MSNQWRRRRLPMLIADDLRIGWLEFLQGNGHPRVVIGTIPLSVGLCAALSDIDTMQSFADFVYDLIPDGSHHSLRRWDVVLLVSPANGFVYASLVNVL